MKQYFYFKIIWDYYRYTSMDRERENLRDSKNLTKFQFKENQKAFAILIMRSTKIRARDSFTLIECRTWICQGDWVDTGTDNGLSSCSKPRGTIIIFLIFYLLQGANCRFI